MIHAKVPRNRTVFLVDGFNVYHSLRDAEADLGGVSTRWLNLRSLLSSYLYVLGSGAITEAIYYFSALATHMEQRKPGVTARHMLYIECLRATGVTSMLGQFKRKTTRCQTCRSENAHFEEKETDVAISSKLLELLHLRQADTVVLVTGDTDLAPAVRTAQLLFGSQRVCIAFPYRRKNAELSELVHTRFYIRKQQYAAHQFPDHLTLPNGKRLRKPARW